MPFRELQPEAVPQKLRALIRQLMGLLLEGEQPAMAILREQYRKSRIVLVELSGVGFFATFEVPGELPTTVPENCTGGHAHIELAGVKNGAGCVLFVREGRIAMLEAFTYADDLWPDDPDVPAISDVVPIQP